LRHVTRFAGGPFFPRREAGVAAFETPAFVGAAFFFAADAAGFVTVFWGDVAFFAGVVLSALQPSAASAAMAAQHKMVRMLVVQFSAVGQVGCLPHTQGQRAVGSVPAANAGAHSPLGPRAFRWYRNVTASPGFSVSRTRVTSSTVLMA